MNKTVKTVLLVAVCLVLVGLIVVIGLLLADKLGLVQVGKYTLQTNTTDISQEFQNISIDVDTSNVTLALSEDEHCRVECREPARLRHRVAVHNRTLQISLESDADLLSRIGLSSETLSVTVYLPRAEYQNIEIETDTGTITVNDLVASGKTELHSDTGEIALAHNTLGTVDAESDTADILLNYTTCSGLFEAESDTGNVIFDQSDAAEIRVETDTGDVSGTLLSDKVFSAKSRTGMVVVPESSSGSNCSVQTDTGNIQLRIR